MRKSKKYISSLLIIFFISASFCIASHGCYCPHSASEKISNDCCSTFTENSCHGDETHNETSCCDSEEKHCHFFQESTNLSNVNINEGILSHVSIAISTQLYQMPQFYYSPQKVKSTTITGEFRYLRLKPTVNLRV